MKVLVTGVKGQLGYDVVNELTKRGIEAVGVDIQDMDITDAASVEKVIGEAAPDAVIHCAAYTAVDAADVVAHMCRILKVRMSERPAVPITEVPLMMVPSLILPMTAESHWNLYAEPDR